MLDKREDFYAWSRALRRRANEVDWDAVAQELTIWR